MKYDHYIQSLSVYSSPINLCGEGTLLHEGKQSVIYYQGESKRCVRLEEDFFGRELTSEEVVDLAGAPKNALVYVGRLDNELVLDVLEPIRLGLVSSFRIFKNRKKCRLSIENFEIMRRDCRGRGIGTECFYRQMRKSLELNLEKLQTQTSRRPNENGYYTWARFGFDAKLPDEIVRSLPTTLQRSRSLLNLMKTEPGRLWWRKNGVGLDLTFDLTPPSDSVRSFESYYSLKRSTNR